MREDKGSEARNSNQKETLRKSMESKKKKKKRRAGGRAGKREQIIEKNGNYEQEFSTNCTEETNSISTRDSIKM